MPRRTRAEKKPRFTKKERSAPKRQAAPPLTQMPDGSQIIINDRGYPDIARFSTHLFSLDYVTGRKAPFRTIWEIAGFNYTGKTTLSQYLAGRAAAHTASNIDILFTENDDKEYLHRTLPRADFAGEVNLVSHKTDKKDKDGRELESYAEDQFREFFGDFTDPEQNVHTGILDSISGLVPRAEGEGDFEDANMGVRARLMAKFMREAMSVLRRSDVPGVILMTNHLHPLFAVKGAETSGGVAVHNHSAVRLRLTVQQRDDDGKGLIVSGVAKKSRYRGDVPEGSPFQFVIVSERGVHPGLSAVADCINLKLAQREQTVKMDGKSYGAFSKLVDSCDDDELFEPFFDKLKEEFGWEPD